MQHSDIAAYRREKASAEDKLKANQLPKGTLYDKTISVYAKQRDAEMIPQTRKASFVPMTTPRPRDTVRIRSYSVSA